MNLVKNDIFKTVNWFFQNTIFWIKCRFLPQCNQSFLSNLVFIISEPSRHISSLHDVRKGDLWIISHTLPTAVAVTASSLSTCGTSRIITHPLHRLRINLSSNLLSWHTHIHYTMNVKNPMVHNLFRDSMKIY